MVLDEVCAENCIQGCNSSTPEDPSLFRRNWYSLANSTVMYTIWAGYTCMFVMTCVLFFWSRNIQPIKSRSPDLVLLSGFGGYLLVTNYAMAHYVTGIHRWPCPFSNWSLWFAFPLFLFPFPFRSLRLYLVFKRNVDKVKNHKVFQETTARRVTTVAQRFSVSMDIQRAIQNHEAKKKKHDNEKTKRKTKQEKRTPAIDEQVDDQSLEENDPELASSPTLNNGEARRADVTKSGGFSGVLSNIAASVSGTKKLARALPRGTVRIADVQAAESGIINTQSNRSFLEKYVFHIFAGIILFCFLIGLVRQFVPSLGLGAECVGCLVSLSSAIVQTIIVFIVLGIQLLAAVFIHYNNIRDQFKIGRELELMCLVWFALLFPACILSLRGTECEELRTGLTSCSTFDNFTKFCYYNFAAQHWLIVGCIVVTFLITIVAPVIVTHRKGRKKLLNEPPKQLYPNFKALTSLKDCLSDPDARDAFQGFCIQSFCVERILFWKDIEHFRTLEDDHELKVRAVALYKRYIDPSGHLFLQLPEDIQEHLDNVLAEAAMQEEENAEFDYNFQVNSNIFLPAQMEILRQMEDETFPSFLRSDAARKLFANFKSQAAAMNALREQNLF